MLNFKLRAVTAALATTGFLLAAPVSAQQADNNPALPVQCGLDIVLVLDASGSIKYNKSAPEDQNGAIDKVTDAANAFLNAFSNTNSRVAVVSYSDQGIEQTGYQDVNPGSISASGVHGIAIGDSGGELGPVPVGTTGYSAQAADGRSTNWEIGMINARDIVSGASGDGARANAPRLVVHITDGQPNTYIDPATNWPAGTSIEEAVSAAEVVANDIMLNQNTHIYTVGVAGAASNVANLTRISGPDVYNQADVNQTFDAQNTDVILANNFAALESLLAGFATELCAPSLTITNMVAAEETPNMFDPAAGWDYTADAMADANAYSWVLPNATATETKTVTTDDNGRAQFQWNLDGVGAWGNGTVEVTQTAKAGYQNMVEVDCFRTNRSVTNEPFQAIIERSTGNIMVDVAAEDIVTCEVLNRQDQNVVLETGTRTRQFYRDHPQAMEQCLAEHGGMIDLGVFEVRDEAFDDEIDTYQVNRVVRGDLDDKAETGMEIAMGVLKARPEWWPNGTARGPILRRCMLASRQLLAASCNAVWAGSDMTGVKLERYRRIVKNNCDNTASEIVNDRRDARLQDVRWTLKAFNESMQHVPLNRDETPMDTSAPWDDPWHRLD